MIAQLRRRQYGPRSERLDPEQYRLELDALHEQLRQAEAAAAAQVGDNTDAPAGRPGRAKTGKKKPARNQGALPDDLPTVEDVAEPAAESCSGCGGALHKIGEGVTEPLEWVPGYLQKRKTRKPKYGCRSCESAPVQAEAPASPVPGGLHTCATVAQLLTAKYLDSLQLYRQSEMLARQGVLLDRSTLVRWVGAGGRHLEMLYDTLVADVMASAKIFADQTPIPTLEPGRGKTKKAYFWTYARDDRPWGGPDPPAVVYRYAYSAYGSVAKKRRATGEIVLAECWTHVRCPIYDIYAGGNAPLAEEALRWISDLYAIEEEIRGCDPETRKAVRQEKSKPLLDDFDAWLEARLAELPPKDALAKAFQRIRASWASLTVVPGGRPGRAGHQQSGTANEASGRAEKEFSVRRQHRRRPHLGDRPVADPDLQAQRCRPAGVSRRCARTDRLRSRQDPRPARSDALELGAR
jgi:transposase